VDYSARIQTVHRETNPRYHKLLSAFKSRTGCPVLVNTSFTVRGEPIVCTPEDAFRCFMGTGIEVLAIGNCLLKKEAQESNLKENYAEMFELD
jgi:carbamoyltransferase